MSKKTIEKEPNNSTYLDTYAWILFQNEEYENALGYIGKAYINGGKDSAEINDHYGDILFKNGREEEAIQYWEKSKSLGKKSDELEKKISTGKMD